MHRINRTEVELHSGEASLARELSERVGRMHGPRIVPLLDRVCSRVCSELSAGEAPDRPVRIDRLDLDLGTLTADDLEDAFVAKLEPALRAALANALRWRAGDRRAQASLEILETFALTGSLPWWAPPDRDVVARHFARALEAEADLVALLGRIARDPGALERIARMCDRGALVALVERARAGQRLPRGTDRETIRNPSAADASPPAANRDGRDARRHPDPGDSEQSGRQPAGDETLEQPLSARSRLLDDGSRRRPSADPVALDERPSPGRDAGSGDTATSSDLPPVHQAVEQRPPGASPPTDDGSRRRQRTDPALDERRPPVPPLLASVAAMPPRRVAGTPRALLVPAVPAAIRAVRRGALARLDELYVADAGLVILWPFLERFFVRAGVLGDDRRFLDEAAQLQAVALVEHLAAVDPAPPEFRLPLAKLLCGRPVESDFVLERPLAPEQLAEGDRLLAAVIDRAPVLGALSIPELRARFLARPGALGTRDGAWLLQVERRPHDAVLDRFPWSWGCVRLPWMPAPLRVEW